MPKAPNRKPRPISTSLIEPPWTPQSNATPEQLHRLTKACIDLAKKITMPKGRTVH